MRNILSRRALKEMEKQFYGGGNPPENLIAHRFPELELSSINKRGAFLKHFFWLVQAEEAGLQSVPLLDEGLLGTVENDANTIRELSESLLGLVHVDAEPATLRKSLLGRMSKGNKKGPKNLPSLPGSEAVDLLSNALDKVRRKANLVDHLGVPVLTVNYHQEPGRAFEQVEKFISSVACKPFDIKADCNP